MSGLSGTAMAATCVLKVDGLGCPFSSCGIDKQLRKLASVGRVETDIGRGEGTPSTKKP